MGGAEERAGAFCSSCIWTPADTDVPIALTCQEKLEIYNFFVKNLSVFKYRKHIKDFKLYCASYTIFLRATFGPGLPV